LDGHIEVTYLVQEQGPLVRQFQLAGSGLLRTRKGAPFMAKEFPFQQPMRDRWTAQLDERAVGTRGTLMQQPGNDLFARAAFPLYQYRGWGGRDLPNLLL
jgi:hypothetical protein